jgi:hypothetical protein
VQEEASETRNSDVEQTTSAESMSIAPSAGSVDAGAEAPSSSTVAPPSSSATTAVNEDIANGYRCFMR